MTSAEIEDAANRGNIATADFQIGRVLRRNVVPTFLEDVGRVVWRRVSTSLTPASKARYTLPADYHLMGGVYVNGSDESLPYLGEDAGWVAQAAAETQAGLPTGYWVEKTPQAATRDLVLDRPCDSGVTSLVALYYWTVPFSDETTAVDMSLYIPDQWHWALVEGLRREIYEDRYGQGDLRYQTADAKYKDWITRVLSNRELAPRGTQAVYVR